MARHITEIPEQPQLILKHCESEQFLLIVAKAVGDFLLARADESYFQFNVELSAAFLVGRFTLTDKIFFYLLRSHRHGDGSITTNMNEYMQKQS